ncbi:MAG: hypothetical protein B6242_17405 [Anaerolineaceae bacterium 4572_78]|nr:MAG: hypothetical protein B6242_17405 [Anaerolineaceae bacterium 4572_78]
MLINSKTQKITSEYILMELGNGLSRLHFRHLVKPLISMLFSDSSFMIVPSDSTLFQKAYQLFINRPDK